MTNGNTDQTEENQPNDHSMIELDEYSQFLIRSPSEIIYVLRRLQASADLITVHFNEGRDLFLSSIIALTDDTVTLDCGGSHEVNQRALLAKRFHCVTSHDRVRIQFVLNRLSQTEHDGRPAFIAPLPAELLRLQRREYFRLTTPVANPIKCLIPVPREGGLQNAMFEANVIDISGGGLAMVAPPASLHFSEGDTFENCRIELPDVGIISTTLEIRNIFDVTLRSGSHVTRAGCQFTNLPGTMLTLIQRYIIRVERERKARESGMA